MRQLGYHVAPQLSLLLRSHQSPQLPMRLSGARRIFVIGLAALVTGLAGSACKKREPPAPPVATPSVSVNRDRAPLGSPVDISYKFVVANDAHFDQDYRVFVHVVDTDEQYMWGDDHNPPTPTSEWKPGQTVEYTRTVFIPVYPYVGEATIQVGLYSIANQKRLTLTGEDAGQRSYKVAKLQLQPQTENVPTVFKEGWHPIEVAEQNALEEWQWTKKEATLAIRNPKKDCLLYFDVDNPGNAFQEVQQVQVSLGGQTLQEFSVRPKDRLLEKIPLKAAQLGTGDMVEIQIAVDKTFVPALLPASNSKDPRELGIRVFHAFIDAR
jgi:hypothetical protein